MLKIASLDATWLWTLAKVLECCSSEVVEDAGNVVVLAGVSVISPRKLFIFTMKINVYLLMYRFGHPDFHFVI